MSVQMSAYAVLVVVLVGLACYLGLAVYHGFLQCVHLIVPLGF